MPSSARVQRRAINSDTINFLRLLSAEFNRGYVGDATMIYREAIMAVNLYGILAYRLLDPGTLAACAQVSTLSFEVVEDHSARGFKLFSCIRGTNQFPPDTARIIFARDHKLGFMRGEEVRVQVLTQYTVSFALLSQTLTRFSE
ncbi:hypothetical protein DFH28DRAFT_1132980 [Melampsora americana]|nr:hypothetical protein DFH28DRAFT_1132980 [Melampsora americana]